MWFKMNTRHAVNINCPLKSVSQPTNILPETIIPASFLYILLEIIHIHISAYKYHCIHYINIFSKKQLFQKCVRIHNYLIGVRMYFSVPCFSEEISQKI